MYMRDFTNYSAVYTLITNKGLISSFVYLISIYPTSKPSSHKLPRISKWKFCPFHRLGQKRVHLVLPFHLPDISQAVRKVCHFYLPNLPALCLFASNRIFYGPGPNPHFLLFRSLEITSNRFPAPTLSVFLILLKPSPALNFPMAC